MMAGFDYARMQGTATRLLGRFEQGTVTLKRETPGEPYPAEPWVPVVPTVDTWPLAAVVKREHQRYEGGVPIVETGGEVTFAVLPVAPRLTDMLIIDGAERAITKLTLVPAAGTPVVWKAWCEI